MNKKAQEIVIDCLKEKNMSQTKLADSMKVDRRDLNQKLHRTKDIKVNDFSEMLDHIGYSLDVVDNNGIRKVNEDEAHSIISKKEPKGLFWTVVTDKDGNLFLGIDNSTGYPWLEFFDDKIECFKYLNRQTCKTNDGRILNE